MRDIVSSELSTDVEVALKALVNYSIHGRDGKGESYAWTVGMLEGLLLTVATNAGSEYAETVVRTLEQTLRDRKAFDEAYEKRRVA